MNEDAWHFVALVMDENGQTTAYTDASGSLEEVTGFTDYSSQPHWGSAQTFSFAQEWDGTTPTNFYDGLIDDVSLWKGALSLTEIQALYDAATAGGETLEGDLNGDGAVGNADLDIIRSNWGVAVATVPEHWVGAIAFASIVGVGGFRHNRSCRRSAGL